MNSPIFNTLLAVATTAVLFTGCHHTERCKDIPHGAIPQPIGTYVCQWQHQQMNRAEADDFVIYRYEWLRETDQFSPFGGQHMLRLAERLPHEPFDVVVEPSGEAALDEARVQVAIGLLAEQGIADAHQRVSVGIPSAEGLYGQEAPAATATLLGEGRSTGNFGFGGGGFGSGFRSGFGGGFRGGFGGGFGSF